MNHDQPEPRKDQPKTTESVNAIMKLMFGTVKVIESVAKPSDDGSDEHSVEFQEKEVSLKNMFPGHLIGRTLTVFNASTPGNSFTTMSIIQIDFAYDGDRRVIRFYLSVGSADWYKLSLIQRPNGNCVWKDHYGVIPPPILT